MTYNCVSFVWFESTSHLSAYFGRSTLLYLKHSSQYGQLSSCRFTWNLQGNQSHPKTEADTSPVGRKKKMLTHTISFHFWSCTRRQSSGPALRSWGDSVEFSCIGYWIVIQLDQVRLLAQWSRCTLVPKERGLFNEKFEKNFFITSGSMCPLQYIHESTESFLKQVSLNLSPQYQVLPLFDSYP